MSGAPTPAIGNCFAPPSPGQTRISWLRWFAGVDALGSGLGDRVDGDGAVRLANHVAHARQFGGGALIVPARVEAGDLLVSIFDQSLQALKHDVIGTVKTRVTQAWRRAGVHAPEGCC